MRILPGMEIPRRNPCVNALQAALFPREIGGKNSWQTVVTRLFVGRDALPGWSVYHTHLSTRSQPGFPDMVCLYPANGTIVYAELKTENGKVTDDQAAWLRDLAACDQEVYLWRPSDRDEIDAVLQREHEFFVMRGKGR